MAYMQVFEGSVCVMFAHVLNGLPLHLLRSHKAVSSQQVCGHRALHAPQDLRTCLSHKPLPLCPSIVLLNPRCFLPTNSVVSPAIALSFCFANKLLVTEDLSNLWVFGILFPSALPGWSTNMYFSPTSIFEGKASLLGRVHFRGLSSVMVLVTLMMEVMYIAVSSKRREIGKSGLTFHLFPLITVKLEIS